MAIWNPIVTVFSQTLEPSKLVFVCLFLEKERTSFL